MEAESQSQVGTFLRAWEIIEKDESIPLEEREAILKLIKVLIEAAESAPHLRERSDHIKTFTQEIVSKHSLLTLVKQQAAELDALKSLSLNLTSSLDLQTVLDAVVNEAMRLVRNARTVHIFLYSQDKLEFGSSLNSEGVRNMPLAMPRADGLTHTVVKHGERIIVEDISTHPLYQTIPNRWAGSIVGVPLKFKKMIVGVMNLSRSITGGFSKAELRLIGLLADQAAVAIYNASLHKQVTDLANTDSVTGLPNRRALDERLQDEMRYAKQKNSMFAVVMMDLDGFKGVNDIYGHAAGDEVLHSLFNYLSENMRTTDFLARYGGDELTLVIRDAGLDAAETVTLKILELMKSYKFPFATASHVRLGISAGIAVYPSHARSAGDLLRAADMALYQAKKRNRGSFIIANGATGPLNPLMLPPTE
jgi:diguanylate cyclase (GGDEF)-like protein